MNQIQANDQVEIIEANVDFVGEATEVKAVRFTDLQVVSGGVAVSW